MCHVLCGVATDGGGRVWMGQRGLPCRDALEGKGPQRRPQQRLDGRLEEGPEAVGGGFCRLQLPWKLAFGVRETVTGHRLGALGGGGGGPPPPPPSNASLLPYRAHASTHEPAPRVPACTPVHPCPQMQLRIEAAEAWPVSGDWGAEDCALEGIAPLRVLTCRLNTSAPGVPLAGPVRSTAAAPPPPPPHRVLLLI